MGWIVACIIIGIATLIALSGWLFVHNSRRKVKPNSAIVRLGLGGTQVFLKSGKWVHCVPYLHNCQEFTFRPQQLEIELPPDNAGMTADEYCVTGNISMTISTMRTADAILDACTSSDDGNPWTESAIDMMKSQLSVLFKDHISSHSLKSLQSNSADEKPIRDRLARLVERRGGVVDEFVIGPVRETGDVEYRDDSILNTTNKLRQIRRDVVKDKESHATSLANLTGANAVIAQQRIDAIQRDAENQIAAIDAAERKRETIALQTEQQNADRLNRVQGTITGKLEEEQNLARDEIEGADDTADQQAFWAQKGFKDRQDYEKQKAKHRDDIEGVISSRREAEQHDRAQLESSLDGLKTSADEQVKREHELRDSQIASTQKEGESQRETIRTDEQHTLDELHMQQQSTEHEAKAAATEHEANQRNASELRESLQSKQNTDD